MYIKLNIMANYRTNEKKSYKPREVSKPIKGSLNSFFDKNNRLKVKNSKGFVSDVVLDSTLEDFNVVNTFGITENTTVIGALELLTTNIPTDVNQLTDQSYLLSKCIPKTRSELEDMVTNSELVIGQNYILTDFAQSYNIFDGGTMAIQEEKIGALEPLILKAIATNKFDKVAISPLRPNDIIHYSFDILDIRDIAYSNGVDTPNANFKGIIYYRKDTIQNNECHYNFVPTYGVKYRRWAVDAVTFDNGTAYVAKDVCKASDGKIYKCITATTGEGDPTVNTADWVLWLDITADAFVSWTSDKTLFNIGDITTDNLIINNVTAGVDYDDFYTFGDYYNKVTNVIIKSLSLSVVLEDNGYSTILNNCVFKTFNENLCLFNVVTNGYSFCNTFNGYVHNNNFHAAQYCVLSDAIFLSIKYNITNSIANNIQRIDSLLDINLCIMYECRYLQIICSIVSLNLASLTAGAWSKTIYADKTDGVKLSYMDGGVPQYVDVTA